MVKIVWTLPHLQDKGKQMLPFSDKIRVAERACRAIAIILAIAGAILLALKAFLGVPWADGAGMLFLLCGYLTYRIGKRIADGNITPDWDPFVFALIIVFIGPLFLIGEEIISAIRNHQPWTEGAMRGLWWWLGMVGAMVAWFFLQKLSLRWLSGSSSNPRTSA